MKQVCVLRINNNYGNNDINITGNNQNIDTMMVIIVITIMTLIIVTIIIMIVIVFFSDKTE